MKKVGADRIFFGTVAGSIFMQHNVPQIIRDMGFDFSWDEKKVWVLDIPTEEIGITHLVWHFDIPFLWEGDGICNLTPREVMENPALHKEEYDRTMAADMRYPILDGLHRLMRAFLNGKPTVNVRKIPRGKIPEIVI
ncbi:MAG: hypothetical protein HY006_04280 [Candidatus Sungbacteria bacterium]|nr:hypothetical protein [Candidatus Sungbacteria bacterium]